MLVLSRKKGETIVVDNQILVTVTQIRGDKVRIGITAPRHIPVYRQEVLDLIRSQQPAILPLAHLQMAHARQP